MPVMRCDVALLLLLMMFGIGRNEPSTIDVLQDHQRNAQTASRLISDDHTFDSRHPACCTLNKRWSSSKVCVPCAYFTAYGLHCIRHHRDTPPTPASNSCF